MTQFLSFFGNLSCLLFASKSINPDIFNFIKKPLTIKVAGKLDNTKINFFMWKAFVNWKSLKQQK